jgi:hypothetical protein
MTVEMGNTYFMLDGSTGTKQPLIDFFVNSGFRLVENSDPEDYHTFCFTDDKGLDLEIVWYRNLSHIRFGNWDNTFCEVRFTRIVGSWLPREDHNTFDFYDEDKYSCTLAIKEVST